MQKYQPFYYSLLICLVIHSGAYAQKQFYISATVGSKYSLSTSQRLNVGPPKSTGTFDTQGGLLLGYGNQKVAFETGFFLGTLGIKHNYESVTINSRENFKVVYRADDLLTIPLRANFTWWTPEGSSLTIGSSFGVNMNVQYSKDLSQNSIWDQEKSMQGNDGEYVLKYSDLNAGRQETNFSISSGLFVTWKINSRFDLRPELGYTTGLDQLYSRTLLAGVEYTSSDGLISRGFVGNSVSLAHSKGDHFYCNLSILYQIQKEGRR